MTSYEIQRLILRELRHGSLNHFEIAAAIDQAPFRVRAELKGPLKQARLVREVIDTFHHVWRLTEAGEREAWTAQQLTMGKETIR